ncbi:OmpA family protein [uncultured Jannaschia sp.]|uniref:OmpA family protein n=1 Tax=uncultured Jannaschia sp. TaxID=293347 RepID=UPI0026198A3D|nr:OmpA family protein [uncultured Jannaschia sp.]
MSSSAGLAQLAMPYPGEITFEQTTPLGSRRVATGPFDNALPFARTEGNVTQRVWRLDAPEATGLQLLAPLREQLVAEGWDVVFSCRAETCGGFEFRFELDIAPAPAMFVDLAAYRYLAARKDDAWTTIVASPSGAEGYIQVTTVTPADAPPPPPPPEKPPAADPVPQVADIAAALDATGRAVLDDLVFATGSTALEDGDYASLAELAAYLEARPETNVALVGHTDAQGPAAANMALSRRRAESARDLLTGRYGVAGERVETYGAGYFTPVAPNDTEAGRRANRRVEAVITSVP